MPMRHIVISDKMVRQRIAVCKYCGARAFIGEYDDDEHGDTLLAEWVIRHRHEKENDVRS